jgi:hypothetical protein
MWLLSPVVRLAFSRSPVCCVPQRPRNSNLCSWLLGLRLGASCTAVARDMVQGREPGQGVRHAACPSAAWHSCHPRQPRVQLRLPAHARHARLHSSDMPVVARQVCGEFDVRDVWDRKSHGGGGVDGAPRRERNTSADIVVVFLNTRHSKDPRRDPRSRLNTRIRHTINLASLPRRSQSRHL